MENSTNKFVCVKCGNEVRQDQWLCNECRFDCNGDHL